MRMRLVDVAYRVCSTPGCVADKVEYEGDTCPVCNSGLMRTVSHRRLILVDMDPPPYVRGAMFRCQQREKHYHALAANNRPHAIGPPPAGEDDWWTNLFTPNPADTAPKCPICGNDHDNRPWAPTNVWVRQFPVRQANLAPRGVRRPTGDDDNGMGEETGDKTSQATAEGEEE